MTVRQSATRRRPDTTNPLDKLFPGSSEMAARMREVDWGRTPVGPVDGWPHSVRAIIRMMLTSRYAMWMGWGPQLTFFYNDAYRRDTLGVNGRKQARSKYGAKSG